ncbi:MAG: hypothetical protein OSJ61_07705 [Lachnospiraceae bacterium]|nr:hypothetical protein [Lachnospiraceae bacterium]
MTNLPSFKIDKQFKSLVRPLSKREYTNLENTIISNGCHEQITVWGNIVIDGIYQYEICLKNNIEFNFTELTFDCREAVIAWICAHQLRRDDLTEEMRRFLIGLQYETEKLIIRRKSSDLSHRYYPEDDLQPDDKAHPSRHITAQRIATENNVSYGTVQKFALYTRALEKISAKAPELVLKILSGKYKISHKNIIEISKMPTEEINRLMQQLEQDDGKQVIFKKARCVIQNTSYLSRQSQNKKTVKDMPTFDPDAPVTELALTIPSWLGSINRTIKNTNFTTVSKPAKNKLFTVITKLEISLKDILELLKEKTN